MGRKANRLVAVLLVFAATICIVGILSAATHESPQAAADRYMEQVRTQSQESGALSAPATGEPGISIFASLAAFLGILMIPLTSFLLYARSRRAAEKARSRRALRRSGLNYRYRV